MPTLILIVIMAVTGFFVSLRIYPLAKCGDCEGTGLHHAFRPQPCRKCGGTGRVDRLGTRIIFGSGVSLRLEDSCANAAVRLAGWLVGSKHAGLREAWSADLYGDPERRRPSPARRLRLATGFVVTAIWVRLHRLTDLVWWPVDALLASWHASQLAVLTPVTVAAGLILSHEGLYGLVTNAENLGVIAAAPYAAIKGLRKYRQIATPKRPEKKASSTAERER